MPSRRKHSKSRNGCVQCKERKVKCDQSKPSCTRCLQRQNSCYYNPISGHTQVSTPSSHALPLLSPQPTFNQPNIGHVPKNFWNDVFPYLAPTPSEQAGSDHFRDHDLELLHHYSVSTFLTLANGFSLEEFWQVVMPTIALSNTYLMHGLLALSACHLLHLRPESGDYYSNLAVHHHIEAVSLFRAVLDNVDEQSAVPALAFSALIACLSFAMPQEIRRTHAPEPTFVKNILDVFRLVRGVKSVMASTSLSIKDSPVAPLLTMSLPFTEGPLDFHAEIAVRELEARILSCTEPMAIKNDYLDAVMNFRRCYPRGAFEAQHQALVSAWPVMVRDSFFGELLGMKPGIGLVTLGYYGVLMHLMRSTWWIQDKGRRLVEGIVNILTPEWQPLMSWPKGRVGIE